MKRPLLIALTVLLHSCADLTTSTDMVFDSAPDGPATFERVQTTVFDVSCASSGCHGGQRLARPLRRQGVREHRHGGEHPGVPPGVPGPPRQQLSLSQAAAGGPGLGRGRMPLGGPYLDAASLEIVRAWIERGAPAD